MTGIQIDTKPDYKVRPAPQSGDNMAGIILWGLFTAAGGIILLSVGLSSISKFGAQETSCFVSNVTFPESLPTTQEEIDSNFVSCDCGRRCMSDLGYCVKIYITPTDSNATYLLGNTVNNDLTHTCTYSETSCIAGEEMGNRLLALEEAANLAQQFITLQNNSASFPCFEYDNTFFLENNLQDTINILIGVGIFTGICLMLTLLFVRWLNN